MNNSSGKHELEVVRTEDLARVLRTWAEKFDLDHPTESISVTRSGEAQGYGSIEYLHRWSGVSRNGVMAILKGKYEWTGLSRADALLTATDLSYLLQDELIVVPNPYLSPEFWASRMAERGCEPG